MIATVVLGLVLALACGWAANEVAARRGAGHSGWWIAGFFLGPLAILGAALARSRQ